MGSGRSRKIKGNNEKIKRQGRNFKLLGVTLERLRVFSGTFSFYFVNQFLCCDCDTKKLNLRKKIKT